MKQLFTDLNSMELKKYIDETSERRYAIIDVRQPEEYRQSHIPGSFLIPLADFLNEKAKIPEKDEIVFVCRSGARSRTAAVFANTLVKDSKNIYNLSGGILEWFGRTIDGKPEVQLLGDMKDLDRVILSAMELEKGAFNFYHEIISRFPGEPFLNSMVYLSKAETEHAKALYRVLEKRNVGIKGDSLPDFTDMFDSLRGDILEGGVSLYSAIDDLESVKEDRAVHILDLCLDIEYAAFDLYKNAAVIAEDEDIKKILESIANGEKNHMKELAEAFTLT